MHAARVAGDAAQRGPGRGGAEDARPQGDRTIPDGALPTTAAGAPAGRAGGRRRSAPPAAGAARGREGRHQHPRVPRAVRASHGRRRRRGHRAGHSTPPLTARAAAAFWRAFWRLRRARRSRRRSRVAPARRVSRRAARRAAASARRLSSRWSRPRRRRFPCPSPEPSAVAAAGRPAEWPSRARARGVQVDALAEGVARRRARVRGVTLAPNASGAVASGSSVSANARRGARGAPFADARVCSSHSPHSTRRASDAGCVREKMRFTENCHGKFGKFGNCVVCQFVRGFSFVSKRFSKNVEPMGKKTRVATRGIARSTARSGRTDRVKCSSSVQDRQGGFTFAALGRPGTHRSAAVVTGVRIATSVRACARVIRRVDLRARDVGERVSGMRGNEKAKMGISVRVGVNKRARARGGRDRRARAAARRLLARAREMDGRGVAARDRRASATRGRVGTRARGGARPHSRPTADDSGRREAGSGTSRDAPVRRAAVARRAESARQNTSAFADEQSVADPAHVGVRPSRALRSAAAAAAVGAAKKCAGKKCAFRGGGGRGRFADRTNPLSGRVRFRPNRVINRRSGVESPDCGTYRFRRISPEC